MIFFAINDAKIWVEYKNAYLCNPFNGVMP
jgi:hypothetical protein